MDNLARPQFSKEFFPYEIHFAALYRLPVGFFVIGIGIGAVRPEVP